MNEGFRDEIRFWLVENEDTGSLESQSDHSPVPANGEYRKRQTRVSEHLIRKRLQVDIYEFLSVLEKERRCSPHTIDAYRRDLERLLDFAVSMGLTAWPELSRRQIRTYLGSMVTEELSPATIKRRLASSRSFFRFLKVGKLTAVNPFEGMRGPKKTKRLPELLSVEEIEMLLEGLHSTPSDKRDAAILELLYSSGLRLSELSQLNVADIDLRGGLVRVLGKGREEREVPVGSKARLAVKRWLRARRKLAKPGETALFVNRWGSRLGNRGIQFRLDQWAEERNLGRKFHPHLLRHSFATHMLQSSGDLRAVQELLGHKYIANTEIYIHLDMSDISREYGKAHPRARRSFGKKPT